MYLLYNTELLKGMLRPIFRYAASEAWEYDFAPHDAGQYPLATGQVYGLENGELLPEMQMPVEECGNFILTVAAVCRAEGSNAFADENAELMEKWANYLV
jgi:hypothetical protein